MLEKIKAILKGYAEIQVNLSSDSARAEIAKKIVEAICS
jgi:hypothetical protein